MSTSMPSLPRPVKELKAFKKVDLRAGDNNMVELELPVSSMAVYNDQKHQWEVENDKFTIHCGTSSTDLKSSCIIRVKD